MKMSSEALQRESQTEISFGDNRENNSSREWIMAFVDPLTLRMIMSKKWQQQKMRDRRYRAQGAIEAKLKRASRQFFTAVSNISENASKRSETCNAAPWWLWFCLAPDEHMNSGFKASFSLRTFTIFNPRWPNEASPPLEFSHSHELWILLNCPKTTKIPMWAFSGKKVVGSNPIVSILWQKSCGFKS